jgi:ABC-type glycerol-3-phosphate transport system substrate-binding protein
MEALGKEFIASLGTKHTTIKTVLFEDQKELETTLLDALAEGTGPDVIFSNVDWILHNPTKIIPLSNDESLSIEKFDRTFLPAGKSLISGTSILGIPLEIQTLGIFYNIGYFEQYLNQKKPPFLWENFHSVIQSITKQDNSLNRFSISGAALGRVDNITYGIEIFENILTQAIENLFDKNQNPQFSQKTGVTSDGKRVDYSLDVLNYFLSFADSTHSNFCWNTLLAREKTPHKDFLSFAKGETALVFGTVQDFDRIESIITTLRNAGETTISSDDIGIHSFPQFQTKGGKEALLASLRTLAVPISTRDRRFAWNFLKFALREENLRGYTDVTKTISAHHEIALEQQSDTIKSTFAKQSIIAHVPQYPFTRNEIQTSFASLIQDIQQGKITTSEGLEWLAKQFLQKLKRRKILYKNLNTIP